MPDDTTLNRRAIIPIIVPPFICLADVAEVIVNTPLQLGAQNVSYAAAGAHTGEISAEMLTDIGVTYAIIGHSERRHLYHEDDSMVAKRTARALSSDLKPIICVGETLEEREQNKQFAICRTQLSNALQEIPAESARRIIIAYEPVWAIGTGKTARPEDALEMHRYLRTLLAEIYSSELAGEISILYGGSVKPENSAALLAQPDIDGALIGGASLKAESFLAIIKSAL